MLLFNAGKATVYNDEQGQLLHSKPIQCLVQWDPNPWVGPLDATQVQINNR